MACGRLDLSRANLLSARWLAYVELILEEQAAEDLKQYCLHSSNRALLNVVALMTGKSQSFDLFKQLAAEEELAHEHLLRILLGFEAKSKTEHMSELRSLWVENFGDPKDPKVQEAIEQTVQALLRGAA